MAESHSEQKGVASPCGERRRPCAADIALVGLFVIVAIYGVHVARPVLLPLILALLVTLVLKPVHRLIEKVTRLPSALASVLVVMVACAVLGVGLVKLLSPATAYGARLRDEIVQHRLRSVFSPLKDIQQEITTVAREVENITKPAVENKEEPKPSEEAAAKDAEEGGVSVLVEGKEKLSVMTGDSEVEVEASEPPVKVEVREDPAQGIMMLAQTTFIDGLATLALVYFFLSFGDRIIRRLMESDSTADIIEELTRDVSFYLFTITVINFFLGCAIGTAMWMLGLPNPVLWGAMGAIFNFVPYIGAIGGTAIVFLVAATTFEDGFKIACVPVAYYLLTAIEGSFVTPAIIGRRFSVNPIVVFLWVLCWGALWGLPGLLVGLPVLMVFRIIVHKVPALSRLERIITA